MIKKHDVFISYASEDKASIVDPLAKLLERLGVSVWYAEFVLKVGDSLSETIAQALAKSHHGVVILSPNFIAKRWPRHELGGLTTSELSGQLKILPIWHGLTHAEVLEFSPPLADKLALDTSKLTLDQIAVSIVSVVRPDIYDNLLRIQAWQQLESTGIRESRPAREFRRGPVRHRTLPKSIRLRVGLVMLSLGDSSSMTIDRALDNFRRDLHPERELLVWENIAAAFLSATRSQELSTADRRRILGHLLSISFYQP